jgi:hypothetical protein
LHPALHVQLFVDLVQTPTDRAQRDGKLASDFLVGVTVSDQLQNFLLPRGQRLSSSGFGFRFVKRRDHFASETEMP